jgi:hypothetical protein
LTQTTSLRVKILPDLTGSYPVHITLTSCKALLFPSRRLLGELRIGSWRLFCWVSSVTYMYSAVSTKNYREKAQDARTIKPAGRLMCALGTGGDMRRHAERKSIKQRFQFRCVLQAGAETYVCYSRSVEWRPLRLQRVSRLRSKFVGDVEFAPLALPQTMRL